MGPSSGPAWSFLPCFSGLSGSLGPPSALASPLPLSAPGPGVQGALKGCSGKSLPRSPNQSPSISQDSGTPCSSFGTRML